MVNDNKGWAGWTVFGYFTLVLTIGMLQTVASFSHGQSLELPGLHGPAVNLGGWTDEFAYQGWRIQRNAMIGHFRLLCPQNHRHAFGSYETCIQEFQANKQSFNVGPMPKHVVVMLHGLGSTPLLMRGFADYIVSKGGLHVENIGYASTVENVAAFAKSLDHVIRGFEGVEQVDFVAHSIGNIVIRRYLGDLERNGNPPPVGFGRMVMISPPNHGAELVDMVSEKAGGIHVFRSLGLALAGDAAKELAPRRGWIALEKTLVIPPFEFGIIAGGTGDERGYLAQLPGDDDGLLTVETMKLDGAADFVQVKGIHQLQPQNDEVRAQTLSFLQHGRFGVNSN